MHIRMLLLRTRVDKLKNYYEGTFEELLIHKTFCCPLVYEHFHLQLHNKVSIQNPGIFYVVIVWPLNTQVSLKA